MTRASFVLLLLYIFQMLRPHSSLVPLRRVASILLFRLHARAVSKSSPKSTPNGPPPDPISFDKNFFIERSHEPMLLDLKNAHPLDVRVHFEEVEHVYSLDGEPMRTSVTSVTFTITKKVPSFLS
jgi:hypothetical protein